jgi:cytochrome c-type biogenesis protein CcmH
LRAKLVPNDPLFVYAKADQGPPMPLATQRLAAIDLPMTVTLDDSHAMMPEMKLSMFGKIIVGARVSKSGIANAAAGDFQGTSAVLSQPVNAPIKITIDEVRQ